VADVSLAGEALGFMAETSLGAGLEATWPGSEEA
jgi:hypothetical protein